MFVPMYTDTASQPWHGARETGGSGLDTHWCPPQTRPCRARAAP